MKVFAALVAVIIHLWVPLLIIVAVVAVAGLPAITSGARWWDGQLPVRSGALREVKLQAQVDGSFSFESATAFPNVYLSLVGSGVTASTDSGGGIVNCQFNANGGGHEKFLLNVAS
ncbi:MULTISPECIES: hypothetical protein [unclassified Micromonospora]|uniref:hypothetical protein n=1 Tax=unclassified Micromonospora TaxID=2617518 RepID=UPI00098CF2D0|nr:MULTISPECIES: hypothetical protein [unclassified Micromonospora]MDI5937189.1 hypothetical protein [Micromonospora sp. DH15]